MEKAETRRYAYQGGDSAINVLPFNVIILYAYINFTLYTKHVYYLAAKHNKTIHLDKQLI